MRIESSVTSISWIPSEAVTGLATKMPFEWGIAHYDTPPPEVIDSLDALREADRFRFANELHGWIEVVDGRVVDYGCEGRGHIGSTTLRVGSHSTVFEAVALPELRPDPTVTSTSVRFTQTTGGRTGVPAPRRVKRPPFLKLTAPLAWTTLALTIRADGTVSQEVAGASPFPRHWVYDHDRRLVAKTGMIDFASWYRKAFGRHSPWGAEDSPALVTAIESALDRQLSLAVMAPGSKPKIRRVRPGRVVMEQGTPGDELFLLLDGVVEVAVDGKHLVELGPGAVIGERAVLERGTRTATVKAVTPCRLAVVTGDRLDRGDLQQLSGDHHREATV
jgi:hypothetical protein